MDILLVDFKHLTVVVDCLIVLPKFRVAVCPIVEGFQIAQRTELQFIRVILNRFFEVFKLAVDQAPVAVDHWVVGLQANRLVKVV